MKKKTFAVAYIAMPIILFFSMIIWDFINGKIGMNTFIDIAGITVIYYFIVSVISYIKWKYTDE